MNHSLSYDSDAKAHYDKVMKNANSTYGVPKMKILVKLASGLNIFNREIIANGIK